MTSIKVIDPTKYRQAKKSQVDAYCPVSTSSLDRLISYETQVWTYQRKISDNEDWVLVDILPMKVLSESVQRTGLNFPA